MSDSVSSSVDGITFLSGSCRYPFTHQVTVKGRRSAEALAWLASFSSRFECYSGPDRTAHSWRRYLVQFTDEQARCFIEAFNLHCYGREDSGEECRQSHPHDVTSHLCPRHRREAEIRHSNSVSVSSL